MNLDQLVAQAVRYVMDDGLTPADAAEKAFVADDEEAVRYLAVVGLRSLVGDEISGFRAQAEGVHENEVERGRRSGRFQLRTMPEEAAASYYWLSKPYATADGRMAAILDMTLAEDVPHNLEIARARRVGWEAREGLWAAITSAAMTHPRVKVVSEFPQKVLKDLESVASRALQGQAVVV